jgi:hypothetical protein
MDALGPIRDSHGIQRNEEELTANGAGVPGAFLTSRQCF